MQVNEVTMLCKRMYVIMQVTRGTSFSLEVLELRYNGAWLYICIISLSKFEDIHVHVFYVHSQLQFGFR